MKTDQATLCATEYPDSIKVGENFDVLAGVYSNDSCIDLLTNAENVTFQISTICVDSTSYPCSNFEEISINQTSQGGNINFSSLMIDTTGKFYFSIVPINAGISSVESSTKLAYVLSKFSLSFSQNVRII
jgi:hypothetical protein